ncbi:hypothetical protein OL239_16280 [Arthrobacter sp. ATA002]|uniref:hypothetical protein n=1 Tax=Arthrobacter sp. ATA002 TaxID=2991715 RepID=UPI0022A7DBD3|nr:hypothetical protein [Arthrobacter sp. ATA002]WAP51363.1 hypothetical protein OL239_16280 [Arthrobacter sp. ATA002]
MWGFLGGTLIGAVFGALVWAGAGRWLQGAREKRALQALITQVHLKRALAETRPGAAEPDFDAARCRSAVADIRQQVRETLSELRPGSSSPAAALLEMHRACDAYLRETEGNARNYQARMRELRPVLNQSARRLSSGRHIRYLAPGERAAVSRRTAAAAASRPAAGSARGNPPVQHGAAAVRGRDSGGSRGDRARRIPAHSGASRHHSG